MSKKMKKAEQIQNPFIVHGDSLNDRTAFPTHTHGLTEIGWPEFFIDPLAFGGIGNGQRINAIWEYLSKPENRQKLQDILNGKVVKITDRELLPGKTVTNPDTYCLREVPRSFEGVRLAYPYEADDLSKKMRFVQVWVEGDDYVLMDEYFKGGVKW
jgi:hypothetical protein